MSKHISPQWIETLAKDQIFVFGSNLEGQHGGGAAALALKWGAVWGQGVGLQGQTYGIPTMHGGVDSIKPYVDDFIQFAIQHPKLQFMVTEIGCGIAGFTPEQIAPLFRQALDSDNVYLPQRFYEILIAER